jgi:hypothetical protein
LFTDLERWPEWGPSIRSARWEDGGPMRVGARGVVTTVLGVRLPFVITSFEDGRSWGWSVAGVPATDHAVLPGEHGGSCVARFRVPFLALPYLAVCDVALRRIDELATSGTS